jgi:hypothetical protein
MTLDRILTFSTLVTTLLTGAFSLGCALEHGEGAAPDEPALGEVESPLNLARWFASWGTTNGPDLDLGPSTDRTCFLAGVAGNLNVGWGWDHAGRESEAAVWIKDSRWIMTAAGGHDYDDVVMNNPVNAHAICIGTTTNRVIFYTGGAGGSVNNKVVIAPVTANRQCFLHDISGYSGTWWDSNARVKVFKENGNWVMESANLGTSDGIPNLGAVCVDVPAGTWVGTGSWGASNPGVFTANIEFEGTAAACGLTGISGPLKANEWDDGAMINWPASSPGTWTMRLEDGKTGFVTCVE